MAGHEPAAPLNGTGAEPGAAGTAAGEGTEPDGGAPGRRGRRGRRTDPRPDGRGERPRALDLFCGGGGAARGLVEAGFAVTGVDVEPACRSTYPGTFHERDLRNGLPAGIDPAGYELVWASPPCQFASSATPRRRQAAHENLIGLARALIGGHPRGVIENVPRAAWKGPMRADVRLTGPMVGLGRICRERIFELTRQGNRDGFGLLPALPFRRLPSAAFARGEALTITRSLGAVSHYYARQRRGLPGKVPIREAREAMGIDPDAEMTALMLGEAVPPAYAAWIARMLLEIEPLKKRAPAGA